jgi:multiple sugar transport system permease protein
MTTTELAQPLTGATARVRTVRHAPAGENRSGWLFSLPFLALYLLFLIGPVLIGLVVSLFNTTTVKSGLGGWVGLSNYRDVLTSSDFWSSMWHSVLFTLLTTPLLIILPLLFAIFAARLVHNKWFFRLAFFAPYVVPSSAVCLIFAFMYTPQTGLITKAFGWVGLSSPNFLGSANGAWFAVVLLTLWWTFGFNFILYTAAIQDISQELYEAATTSCWPAGRTRPTDRSSSTSTTPGSRPIAVGTPRRPRWSTSCSSSRSPPPGSSGVEPAPTL